MRKSLDLHDTQGAQGWVSGSAAQGWVSALLGAQGARLQLQLGQHVHAEAGLIPTWPL